jgi:hypothetical protein
MRNAFNGIKQLKSHIFYILCNKQGLLWKTKRNETKNGPKNRWLDGDYPIIFEGYIGWAIISSQSMSKQVMLRRVSQKRYYKWFLKNSLKNNSVTWRTRENNFRFIKKNFCVVNLFSIHPVIANLILLRRKHARKNIGNNKKIP